MQLFDVMTLYQIQKLCSVGLLCSVRRASGGISHGLCEDVGFHVCELSQTNQSSVGGRSRKKYKAPAPPAESHGQDSSSPDSCHRDTLDPPVRRVRLFKTRAETKKTASGANTRKLEQEHASSTAPSPLSPLTSIQRSLSSPEFQVRFWLFVTTCCRRCISNFCCLENNLTC